MIPPFYTVLVVDDDPDIHALTQLALKRMRYENRTVHLASVHSGEEALGYIKTHPETAVVLMDVVMENDHAGLDACNAIRNELKNGTVRLVLRTGQPGQAPEKEVIETYEIDGYLAKSEMTQTRLFTAVRTALKSYTELRTTRWLSHVLTFLTGSVHQLDAHGSIEEALNNTLDLTENVYPFQVGGYSLQLKESVQGKALYENVKSYQSGDSVSLEGLHEELAKSDDLSVRPFKDGILVPFDISTDIGQGAFYFSPMPIISPVEAQALFQVMGLLTRQLAQRVYDAIIKEQMQA